MKRFALLAAIFALVMASTATAQSVWINELHYDDADGDVNEGVEIAGPAGTDLSGYTVYLYNGNGGAVYGSMDLSTNGVTSIPDDGSGYGCVWCDESLIADYSSGIQNGYDAIALYDGSDVVQFLAYEGDVTATDGVCSGTTALEISVSESNSTLTTQTLQLQGTGTEYSHFTWAANVEYTHGLVNEDQTFATPSNTFSLDNDTVTFLDRDCEGVDPDYATSFEAVATITAISATTISNVAVPSGEFTFVSADPVLGTALAAGETQELTFSYTPTAADGVVDSETATLTVSSGSPSTYELTLTGVTCVPTTISALRSSSTAAGDGVIYKVSGYATSCGGNSYYYFIQDRYDGDASTMGIEAYSTTDIPANGDYVTIYGEYAVYYTYTPEIVVDDRDTVNSSTNVTVVPVSVTASQIAYTASGSAHDYFGVHVTIPVANDITEISTSYGYTYSATDPADSDATFYIYCDSDYSFYTTVPVSGDDIEGTMIYNYNSGSPRDQICPWDSTQVPVEMSGFSIE